MMTLDEAIAHAELVANNCEGECADEHRQLSEWLKELRERQDVDAEMEDERNLLFERLGNCREALTDARAENAKLRELVHDFALFAKDAVNKYGIELEAGHDVDAPPVEWKECLYELEMLVNRMRDIRLRWSDGRL